MPSTKIYFDAIEQGATFSRVFTLKDSDGNLIDLTGCTARMQFRTTYGGTLVSSLTTENGKITLGGVAGTVTIEISASDTAAFLVQTLYYDLEIIWATGRVTRLFEGSAPVTPEVTT